MGFMDKSCRVHFYLLLQILILPRKPASLQPASCTRGNHAYYGRQAAEAIFLIEINWGYKSSDHTVNYFMMNLPSCCIGHFISGRLEIGLQDWLMYIFGLLEACPNLKVPRVLY